MSTRADRAVEIARGWIGTPYCHQASARGATAAGSFARGVLGQPTAFYAPTAMQLDAAGGDFGGGTVRIAVHYMELALPDL